MKNKLLFFIINFSLSIFHCQLTNAANYYWVGGTGNWSNYGNHWATTSGGNIFHTQVPTSFDDVHFDANSFTANGQIVTNDTTIAYCRDMDWTGATNNPVFEAANSSIQLKIFGSLTLNPNMNFSFNGQLTFASFNPGKTIQTFSHVLHCPIEFNGAGGEWAMLDSLTTTKNCTLTYGTLRTNNNYMSCSSFYSNNNNARALYLGTSTVAITQLISSDWNVSNSLVIDADSSIIKISGGGHFRSDGHTYNIIEWELGGSGWENSMELNDYIINKVISLDQGYELWFNGSHNIRVDSVFTNGTLSTEYGGLNFFNYIWVNQYAGYNNSGHDTVMKMIVGGDLSFNPLSNGSQYIHDVTVGNVLTIGQNGTGITFDSCRVYDNANILAPNNHLGVFSMMPGKTLTLLADSTQYIDSLSATGNPGFPIQIISSDLGHAANVVIQKDLCTDYLYIHAVHATSPGFLFVGANSNDVANNSGWIFANCITGMEESADASLSIFPNPATDELRIKNAEFRIERIEIYDVVGQRVFSQLQTANDKQQTVNVSELNPGIYFAKIKSEQQELIAKFVKQ